jgi:hypothetical protein
VVAEEAVHGGKRITAKEKPLNSGHQNPANIKRSQKAVAKTISQVFEWYPH